MRAARLLQVLLLLQNRGRLTSASLAAELEVTPRTILRDVDALSEASLPIVVHHGNLGGIERGFNYRTRLPGLATDEAEALALWLAIPPAPACGPDGWALFGPPLSAPVPMADWGDINISRAPLA